MPDPNSDRFPSQAGEQKAWILAHRPKRVRLDPRRPHAFFLEEERSAKGAIEKIATLFLTNRECPWNCLMCDLWRHTLDESVPLGALPEQIDFALQQIGSASQIKLYNSGSFFDPKAIPPDDWGAIALRLQNFSRVIVECHPALIGEACARFRDLIPGQLEIAMGLETVNPHILPRLNKGMTLKLFASAAEKLRAAQLDLRVFILVKPPFENADEAVTWASRALDFAFDCGATVASLIPTRTGNGAMEALQNQNEFDPPRLSHLEAAMEYGIGLGRGRVFADLWDLERFSRCDACFTQRKNRLAEMNRNQQVTSPIRCSICGD